MPTGLLIRDFFKETRELRYSGSGSIEFSEIEKNAYRLALTLEITHIDAPRYPNLRTIPENTHFGYCTLFRGSTITNSLAIKYPKFRLFDIINQGIWNYHQASESLSLPMIGLGNQVARYVNRLAEFLADPGPTPIWEIPDYTLVDSISDLPVLELIFPDYAGIEDTEGEQPPASYRAFPVASPFPDIAKFKADVPMSFLFRLEAWYLVNPLVYVADNPTDSGDQTEGESEYPEPIGGDGDGDGDEFPDDSPRDPDRDSRDYTGGREPPILPGSTVTITVLHRAYSGGCGQVDYSTDHTVGYFGSTDYTVEFIGTVNGCDGPNTAGGIRLNIPGAASIDVAVLEEQQYGSPEITGFVVNPP